MHKEGYLKNSPSMTALFFTALAQQMSANGLGQRDKNITQVSTFNPIPIYTCPNYPNFTWRKHIKVYSKGDRVLDLLKK